MGRVKLRKDYQGFRTGAVIELTGGELQRVVMTGIGELAYGSTPEDVQKEPAPATKEPKAKKPAKA